MSAYTMEQMMKCLLAKMNTKMKTWREDDSLPRSDGCMFGK
jgi:hypothetical protein